MKRHPAQPRYAYRQGRADVPRLQACPPTGPVGGCCGPRRFPQRAGGRIPYGTPSTMPPIHALWAVSHLDPSSELPVPSRDTPPASPAWPLRLLGWVTVSHSP